MSSSRERLAVDRAVVAINEGNAADVTAAISTLAACKQQKVFKEAVLLLEALLREHPGRSPRQSPTLPPAEIVDQIRTAVESGRYGQLMTIRLLSDPDDLLIAIIATAAAFVDGEDQ